MSNVEAKGSGLLFAVFVVFLTLKLAGVISWSWWLVTLPLWISFAFGFSIIMVLFTGLFVGFLIYLLISSIAWIWDKLFEKY